MTDEFLIQRIGLHTVQKFGLKKLTLLLFSKEGEFFFPPQTVMTCLTVISIVNPAKFFF